MLRMHVHTCIYKYVVQCSTSSYIGSKGIIFSLLDYGEGRRGDKTSAGRCCANLREKALNRLPIGRWLARCNYICNICSRERVIQFVFCASYTNAFFAGCAYVVKTLWMFTILRVHANGATPLRPLLWTSAVSSPSLPLITVHNTWSHTVKYILSLFATALYAW